jgi:hypothetical protein
MVEGGGKKDQGRGSLIIASAGVLDRSHAPPQQLCAVIDVGHGQAAGWAVNGLSLKQAWRRQGPLITKWAIGARDIE